MLQILLLQHLLLLWAQVSGLVIGQDTTVSAADQVKIKIPMKATSIGYMITTSIGSSKFNKNFTLLVDTGSSETWVRGPNCSAVDHSCNGKALDTGDRDIDPIYSSSSSQKYAEFYFKYGVGFVKGEVYSGSFMLGQKWTSPPFSFGVSTEEESGSSFDGILGLAFSDYSPIYKSTNTNSDALSSASAKRPIRVGISKFGIYLASNSSHDVTASSLDLGFWDQSRYSTSSTVWKDVHIMTPEEAATHNKLTPVAWWIFNLGSDAVAKYKGRSITSLSTAPTPRVFADCGMSSIVLDYAVVNRINDALGAVYDKSKDYAVIDCNLVHNLEPIVFEIQGVPFTILPENYIYIDHDAGECSTLFLGVRRGDTGIFGIPFFQSAYVMHSKENPPKIGFSPI